MPASRSRTTALAAARDATTLDRVHGHALLQSGGRTNALRALPESFEQEQGSDFLRLALLSRALPKKGAKRSASSRRHAAGYGYAAVKRDACHLDPSPKWCGKHLAFHFARSYADQFYARSSQMACGTPSGCAQGTPFGH